MQQSGWLYHANWEEQVHIEFEYLLEKEWKDTNFWDRRGRRMDEYAGHRERNDLHDPKYSLEVLWEQRGPAEGRERNDLHDLKYSLEVLSELRGPAEWRERNDLHDPKYSLEVLWEQRGPAEGRERNDLHDLKYSLEVLWELRGPAEWRERNDLHDPNTHSRCFESKEVLLSGGNVMTCMTLNTHSRCFESKEVLLSGCYPIFIPRVLLKEVQGGGKV